MASTTLSRIDRMHRVIANIDCQAHEICMLRLSRRLEEWLPTQPEYRMGMQKVTARLNTGGIQKGIIINSEVFLPDAETRGWLQYFEDWMNVLREAEKSALRVMDVTLIPREPETLRTVRYISVANEKRTTPVPGAMVEGRTQHRAFAATGPAEDAPVTAIGVGEVFKRFSAYRNDRRVTAARGLTPGTFATTKEDADAHVRTGSDAVARYALPNPKPASNVFTIEPQISTPLKRGIAQPANDQLGGGVEVIFVNGTHDGTVAGPQVIPDR